MATDRFDLPVTVSSAAALDAYIRAVDLLLSANVGADVLLDEAIAREPNFALAHVARARLDQLWGRLTPGREAAARARALALAGPLSARERSHVEVVALTVEGAPGRAMEALRAHLAEFPRDGLPLSLALGVYGLFGFSGRRDHHDAQRALLDDLAPHWGEDWWFLGYHGWAQIETGALGAGIDRVERSLAANARNGHAAHARLHGYHEIGDPAGGAAFAETWLKDYDPASLQHCHISWHLALCARALGDEARARTLYASAIRPGVAKSPSMPTLADSASFLWRCYLDGETVEAAEWDAVAAHAARYFPRAGFPFADFHAALVAAATGDGAGLAARIDGLLSLDRAGRLAPGSLVPTLCEGMGALARGEYGLAARILESALPELERLGGSHAQREIVEDSYISTCLRAGQAEKAAALLKARLRRRPSRADARQLASTGLD